MDQKVGSISLDSKLRFILLAFSVIPLVLLGWFISYQVDETRRTAVIRMQKAEQRSVEEIRNLGSRSARYKAEEIATLLGAALADRTDDELADSGELETLREVMGQTRAAGNVATIDLLFHDKRMRLVGPDPHPSDGSPDEPAADRPQRRRYTHVTGIPGRDVRVMATVEDIGIDRTLDRVARDIQGVGADTEEAMNDVMDNLRLMLVLGVAGLAVGATLAGGEIARTITRPIRRLTAAAHKIRQGERDVDLDVRGGYEIQLLADAFKQATGELRDYAASLERKNCELETARRIEKQARHDLEAAQDEMIRMEKMSSLGRLIAGVAHEINTPTGAIYNVTSEAAEMLKGLYDGLHRLRGMEPDELARFRGFLDAAAARRLTSERVTREMKRKLLHRLEEEGIGQPRKYAELLARCHLTEWPEHIEMCRLLERLGVEDVFSALVEIYAGMKISRTSAERISKIVRALRFYSHGGQQTPMPVNVNQSIYDALIIAHNRLKQNAEVELELEEGLPEVNCTDGLTQVWVNLLTNACDAIEEAGRGLGRIRIRTFNSNGDIHAVIEDNGAPVSEEVAQRMFDPFFSTKPPGKGTGLGLSLVMSTVSRNGGKLRFHPNEETKQLEVILPKGSANKDDGTK